MAALSPRLKAIIDALPLQPGLRVIEIGCGPGAAAREVAHRVGPSGHVLAVDRSATAIDGGNPLREMIVPAPRRPEHSTCDGPTSIWTAASWTTAVDLSRSFPALRRA